MKKQKVMFQMKGQYKSLENQLNEPEIGNLREKEFRIMIVKMIHDLRKTRCKKCLPKTYKKLKNKQTKMNNTLEGLNSRITETEEWINGLEDRMVGSTGTEQNIEKRMRRNEDSLRDLWDNLKCTNIHITGAPEGEEREKGPEKIFEEVRAEDFPNIGEEIVSQVQEAQSPRQDKPMEKTLRHAVIKLTKIKDKDKILKVTREK